MARLKYEYFLKTTLKSSASEFLRTTRSHPEVMKHLFEERQITRSDQEEWYKQYAEDENIHVFLAADRKTDVYIGYVIFKVDSLYHRRCEVGYAIHPDKQHQGYGKELVSWSIGQATELEEGVHRLHLTVFPENKAAVKLYESVGFKKEGIARDYVFKGGKYRDVLMMSFIVS